MPVTVAGVLLSFFIASCGSGGDKESSGIPAPTSSGGNIGSAAPAPSSAKGPTRSFPDVDVCSLVPAEVISGEFDGEKTQSSPVKDARHQLCRWNQVGREYEKLEVKVWSPLSPRALAESAEHKTTVKGKPVYRIFSGSHRCELDADMSGYFVGVTRQSYDTVSCGKLAGVLGNVIEAVLD